MGQHIEDQAQPCPRCKAGEGEPCRSTLTNEPLLHAVHWQRLKVNA